MEKNTYQHQELNDCFISLHDCRAEKIVYDHGILSFVFPNGFWITPQHPENHSDTAVRTDLSQVDYKIPNDPFCEIEISVFRKTFGKKVFRESWEIAKFINAVNSGTFQLEFVTQYKGFQSILHKGYIWFDKKPYHRECEIILPTDCAVYRWNQLHYDAKW